MGTAHRAIQNRASFAEEPRRLVTTRPLSSQRQKSEKPDPQVTAGKVRMLDTGSSLLLLQ